MKLITENNFELIGIFSGTKVYDSRHAYEEFVKWYPTLTKADFKKAVQQGIDKIILNDSMIAQYMIISKSKKLRISIEIRQDRYTKEIIGIIPTTLGEFETRNTRNEVELFVEQNKNEYRQFPLREGFNYFVQSGKVFTDFDEIEVD
jgi:hypothetical protein